MSQARDFADSFSAVSTGRRNLIINGAMNVAQRGTSGSIGTSASYLSVDRFAASFHGADQYVGTLSQDSESPTGFSNSLKVTTTTAENTMGGSEFLSVRHKIEAQNLQHLNYGTSNAKTMTLSFWVRSSVTGTYAISLWEADDSRQRNTTYTINAADTWEYKTFTFEGDTTGVIDNDNGLGLEVNWVLAAGSNYKGTDAPAWAAYVNAGYGHGQTTNGVATTANATWYLTGVQLELGNSASPFEHRSYAEELELCKRYYEISGSNTADQYAHIWTGDVTTTNQYYQVMQFTVPKRSVPTVTITSAGQSGFATPTSTNIETVAVTALGTAQSTQARAYFYCGYTADAEL